MALTMNTKVSMPKLELGTKRAGGGPRSRGEQLWLVGGALAAFVLLLIGWFAIIGPQRTDTAAVRTQVTDAQAQKDALTARIATLRNENRNLAKYEAQLASAQAALPTDSGVPVLVQSLQSAAAATSSSLSNLSVGTPTAVTTTSPAVSSPAADGATASSPASAGAGSTEAAAAGTPTPTGVYSMTVSVQVSGSPTSLDRFLLQLQNVQPRAVLITQLTQSDNTSTSAKGGASASTLSLSMLTFMMPATSSATAGTAGAGSSTTGTGTSP